MELDDDVFNYNNVDLFENLKTSDGNNKKSMFKKVLFFDRLREEYLKIKSIKDYDLIQKKLYANKTRREIIEFEIVRIVNNYNGDDLISSKLVNIEKLLKMYDEEIPVDVYEKIINLIIKLELSLGMKIGLFVELCSLYEKEKEKNFKNRNLSYVRKK